MAYQTGSTGSVTQLLDLLNTFLAANGWSVDRRDATTLSVHKNNVYQNLFDNTSEIHLNGATGFSGAAAWNAQPGANANTQVAAQMPGSFAAYHFFADQDYCHVVVEVDPGVFRHFAFGEVEKHSAYIGGQYTCATSWANSGSGPDRPIALFHSVNGTAIANYARTPSVYVDTEGGAKWRHFNHNVSGDITNGAFSTDFGATACEIGFGLAILTIRFGLFFDWVQRAEQNTWNGFTPFAPIHLYARRTGASGMRSPLGSVRDLRICSLVGLNPSQIVTLGTHDWIVFPLSTKGSLGSYPSFNYGYAYKIVP